MQKRILPIAIIAITFISIISWNCTKLDTTDIGSDLLPAVDNVHTFADTLQINSTQGVFSSDSTFISRTDDHAFGINNDPVFGQTTASIFFQLKPDFYPYFIGNAGDTLFGFGAGVDSVVLCLKYTGFYGDSTTPLQVQVMEVVDNSPLKLFRDSTNLIKSANYQPNLGSNIGFNPTTSIDVRRLADTVHYKYGNGYSVNTIRIRLSSQFASDLYRRDTVASNAPNNAFRNDSLFRQFYNGLAVVPVSGNLLAYTTLFDADTRLEIHYKKKNFGLTDTLVTSLVLNSDFVGTTANRSSSTANYISRNRPALPSGDQVIYLQTSPGTFANLNIPALSTLSNRIVHRAELIVEEIPDVTGTADKFKQPNFLYVELKDSGVNKWKPVYFDLNPNEFYDPDYLNPLAVPFYPSSVDYTYFGGYLKARTDIFGNPGHSYTFNITKYVQDIVTNHRTASDMRLSAPFNFKYPQYSVFPINYGNNVAYGRIKVGGGNNPNYKLRLRIIYSKI